MPKKKKATPKKSNAGRPTKYTPEMCQKVDEYLGLVKDEIREFIKSHNPETGFTQHEERLVVNLPTIEDFSTFIDVALSTVYEWSKLYPEFSESLQKINKEQKKRVLNNGLNGTYNSTIAKLILSANHGMSEKTVNTNLNLAIEDESGIDDVLKSNGLI